MNNIILNDYVSERSVEIRFICEFLQNNSTGKILDVGGIPSYDYMYAPINELINNFKIDYNICDFRGGKYKGDFVKYDFKEDKFDSVIFLSSLEHFPQCTESDLIFRQDEDKNGFKKALNILNDNGKILLTVPFGKPIWQKYHQNYDMERINFISEGSKLMEYYTYRLINNEWILTNPDIMSDVLYTDKAYGVGCFIFQKENI